MFNVDTLSLSLLFELFIIGFKFCSDLFYCFALSLTIINQFKNFDDFCLAMLP